MTDRPRGRRPVPRPVHGRAAAALFALTIACVAPAGAEAVGDLRDGRAGRIDFASTTPANPSALMRGTAPAATVTGTLYLPPGAGRGPAMVVAHGSGGVSRGREGAWAARLVAQGVAAFVVDSFGPRGIRSTATDQGQLSTAANVADALHALPLLATHPRIDPARIGVMGFSRGGQVALFSALEPFRRAVLGDGPRFALHIAFYPGCSVPYIPRAVSPAPIAMLLGSDDNYTPAAHCLRYAEQLRALGAAVETRVFPGAQHGFDSPVAPRFMAEAQTARNCRIDILLEPVSGRLWDDGTVLPARRIGEHLRGCMERGASFGGDPAALAAAEAEVARLLATHLRPGR